MDVWRSSPWWEWSVVLGGALALVLAIWLAARWIAHRLHGGTTLGLRGVDRLPAPLALLAAIAAAWIALSHLEATTPTLGTIFDVLAIGGGFWLAARIVDVVWATGKKSARLRSVPAAGSALLAGRYLGRVALVLAAATSIAVRLGATSQLYIVLTALGAALAFAARDPIRNAVAFVAMVLDPPFHLGDRVRIVDFRGGEEAVGEVVRLTLSAVTIRSNDHTMVVLSNLSVGSLRVENLSAADRRRLELAVPIARDLSAEAVRGSCEAIERELRGSPHLARGRDPRVWLSGYDDGLRLEASVWLRRAADRREAERDLFLAIRAELDAAIGDRDRQPAPVPRGALTAGSR